MWQQFQQYMQQQQQQAMQQQMAYGAQQQPQQQQQQPPARPGIFGWFSRGAQQQRPIQQQQQTAMQPAVQQGVEAAPQQAAPQQRWSLWSRKGALKEASRPHGPGPRFQGAASPCPLSSLQSGASEDLLLDPACCVLWNPLSGRGFRLLDPTGDLISVSSVFDHSNVWANVQARGRAEQGQHVPGRSDRTL